MMFRMITRSLAVLALAAVTTTACSDNTLSQLAAASSTTPQTFTDTYTGTLSHVPDVGTFCETTGRVYSVDPQGRRGVVFLSLDAARLVPVLIARAGLSDLSQLPRPAEIQQCRQLCPGGVLAG